MERKSGRRTSRLRRESSLRRSGSYGFVNTAHLPNRFSYNRHVNRADQGVRLERTSSLNVIPTSIDLLGVDERQRLVDERSREILKNLVGYAEEKDVLPCAEDREVVSFDESTEILHGEHSNTRSAYIDGMASVASTYSARACMDETDRQQQIQERSSQILQELYNRRRQEIPSHREDASSGNRIPSIHVHERQYQHEGSGQHQPPILLNSNFSKSTPNLSFCQLSCSTPSSRLSICDSIHEDDDESSQLDEDDRDGNPWEWLDEACDALDNIDHKKAAWGFETVIQYARQELDCTNIVSNLNHGKLLIQGILGLVEVLGKQCDILNHHSVDWQWKSVQSVVLLNEVISRCRQVLRYSSDEQKNLWFEEQCDKSVDHKSKLFDALVRVLLDVTTKSGRGMKEVIELDSIDLGPVFELQSRCIQKCIGRSLTKEELKLKYLNSVDGNSDDINDVFVQCLDVKKFTEHDAIFDQLEGEQFYAGNSSPIHHEEVLPIDPNKHVSLVSTDKAVVCLKSAFHVLSDAMAAVSARVFRQCNYDRALKLYEHTLRLYFDVLTDQARTSAVSEVYLHLGILNCKKGQLSLSQKYLECSLDICKEIYEMPNQHIAASLYELGNVQISLCLKGETILDFVCMATRNELHHELRVDIKDYNRKTSETESENKEYSTEVNEAVTYYSQALSIVKKLHGPNQDHALLASTLARMGDCGFITSNFEDAILYYEEAQGVLRHCHSHRATEENAHVLCMLGCVNFMLHNYAKASTMYQCAHLMRQHHQRDSHLGFSHAFALSLWGMTCLATKNYDKCCSWCLQAYQIYDEIFEGEFTTLTKNKFWLVCETLYALGHCYTQMRLYDMALQYLELVYRIVMAAECQVDKKQTIRILRALGDSHNAQENHTKALKYYNEALELNLSEKRDSCRQVLQNKLLNKGAGIHISMQQYSKAAQYLQKAKVVQKNLEEEIKGDMVSLLFQLGSVYSLSGDVARAIECYQDSLDSYKQMHDGNIDDYAIAPTFGNLALLMHIKACSTSEEKAMSIKTVARDYYQKSLALIFDVRVCLDYGIFLLHVGLFEEAAETLFNILEDGLTDQVIYNELENPILPPLLKRLISEQGEISVPAHTLASYLSVLVYKQMKFYNESVACTLSLLRKVYESSSVVQYAILGYCLMEISMFEEATHVFIFARSLDEFNSIILDDLIVSMLTCAYVQLVGTLATYLNSTRTRSKFKRKVSDEQSIEFRNSSSSKKLGSDWERPHNRHAAEYGRHRTGHIVLSGRPYGRTFSDQEIPGSFDRNNDECHATELTISQKLDYIKKKMITDHGLTQFSLKEIPSYSKDKIKVTLDEPMPKEHWEVTEIEDPWDNVISYLDASCVQRDSVYEMSPDDICDGQGPDIEIGDHGSDVPNVYEEVFDPCTGKWLRVVSNNTSETERVLQADATAEMIESELMTGYNTLHRIIKERLPMNLDLVKANLNSAFDEVAHKGSSLDDLHAAERFETTEVYEEIYNPITGKWEHKETNNNNVPSPESGNVQTDILGYSYKPLNSPELTELTHYDCSKFDDLKRSLPSSIDGNESEELSYTEEFDEVTQSWVRINTCT